MPIEFYFLKTNVHNIQDFLKDIFHLKNKNTMVLDV